jgi:hypothetical protein
MTGSDKIIFLTRSFEEGKDKIMDSKIMGREMAVIVNRLSVSLPSGGSSGAVEMTCYAAGLLRRQDKSVPAPLKSGLPEAVRLLSKRVDVRHGNISVC